METYAQIQCPFCGHSFELAVDAGVTSQRFTQGTDCENWLPSFSGVRRVRRWGNSKLVCAVRLREARLLWLLTILWIYIALLEAGWSDRFRQGEEQSLRSSLRPIFASDLDSVRPGYHQTDGGRLWCDRVSGALFRQQICTVEEIHAFRIYGDRLGGDPGSFARAEINRADLASHLANPSPDCQCSSVGQSLGARRADRLR